LSTRQYMKLSLAFAGGKISGEGTDFIGPFVMSGHYDLTSGKVTIRKQYLGHHLVSYEGNAEIDQGIWGLWTIPDVGKDGFHMWPKAMGDPTRPSMEEAIGTAREMAGPTVLTDA